MAARGKKYSFALAESFAREKSGGVKVDYKNEISIKQNGGWRYKYGNMFYVQLVSQYLAVPHFSDATVQAIFNEALKYQGWNYVYGGSNPNTSFDCSGLVQWCYAQAGISIPRQSTSIKNSGTIVSDPRPGDICWTPGHVAIYIGNGQMIEAQQDGVPICVSKVRATYYIRY